jgi:D-alanyl-D-alanine carboxypeptidase
MSTSQLAPRPRRRPRPTIVAGLVVVTALVGVLAWRSLADTSSGRSTSLADLFTHGSHKHLRGGTPGAPPRQHQGDGRDGHGWLGVTGGKVRDGVTVFDDDYPAVANLDPSLLTALRAAAKAAGNDGVVFSVNSGWRSRAYQRQLLDEAVSKYGSRAEASRWVAAPATSSHVSGNAVDLGPSEATSWLSEHGAAYGLCQTYANEPWHYELRPEAIDGGCPPTYADPTQDPRMHQ